MGPEDDSGSCGRLAVPHLGIFGGLALDHGGLLSLEANSAENSRLANSMRQFNASAPQS